MIISHAHRFVFVKTRKTAGTSLQKYLQNFCDPGQDIVTGISRYEGKNWNYEGTVFSHPRKKKKGDGHISYAEIINRAPEAKDYYAFTIERNPWDKCVSMWWWLKGAQRKNIPLSKLLRTRYVPSDWGRYSLKGKLCVDVLLYESLPEHLPALGETLGLPLDYEAFANVRIKGLYRPEGDEYRTHYTDRMREVVAGKFRREIEAFGYEF